MFSSGNGLFIIITAIKKAVDMLTFQYRAACEHVLSSNLSG